MSLTNEPISIGKLAKATGFKVERIRIWELRYGKSEYQFVLPSGHRRYVVTEIQRLQLGQCDSGRFAYRSLYHRIRDRGACHGCGGSGRD